MKNLMYLSVNAKDDHNIYENANNIKPTVVLKIDPEGLKKVIYSELAMVVTRCYLYYTDLMCLQEDRDIAHLLGKYYLT